MKKKLILIIASVLAIALLLGVAAVAANIADSKQAESESVTCPVNECPVGDGTCPPPCPSGSSTGGNCPCRR